MFTVTVFLKTTNELRKNTIMKRITTKYLFLEHYQR